MGAWMCVEFVGGADIVYARVVVSILRCDQVEECKILLCARVVVYACCGEHVLWCARVMPYTCYRLNEWWCACVVVQTCGDVHVFLCTRVVVRTCYVHAL